jgi:hypothetical protein
MIQFNSWYAPYLIRIFVDKLKAIDRNPKVEENREEEKEEKRLLNCHDVIDDEDLREEDRWEYIIDELRMLIEVQRVWLDEIFEEENNFIKWNMILTVQDDLFLV